MRAGMMRAVWSVDRYTHPRVADANAEVHMPIAGLS